MKQTEIPVSKNQLIELELTGLTHDGAGVGKYQGYTLFVNGGLPEEKVRVKVAKLNKNYGFADIIEIIEPSSKRNKPRCPVYESCGGCQLQHLTYEGQLEHKRNLVAENLKRIGKIENVTIHPTLGMNHPWRYRNKAQIPFAESEGGLISGFYAKGTHNVIDMKQCLIQQEAHDEMALMVRELAKELHIPAYDEKLHQGVLRHVVTRTGTNTGELMLILVTKDEDFSHKKELVDNLIARIPNLTSLIQNVNSERTNVILGQKSITLWGSDVIYDTIGDIKFSISPRSFFQVNPDQTKVLYDKALEYADLSGKETVIDAYCGTGTISLFLAQKAKHVYGVEIVADAIKDAKKNVELNGINNVAFQTGAAEKVILEWEKQGVNADVVVVDPPRKGLEKELIDTIIELKPDRVVYVSCDPGTLARDLRLFEGGGYKVIEVQPVDMFPQTVHVECVVELCRIEKK